MAIIKRVSLVDQVYDKLREKIVTLQIPFGSKLNVSKLQEEYGVSSTPVREALNRLLNEGLIEFENNVGARVIEFDEDDVRQVQELSFAYQMVAVRNSLRYGDSEKMAEEIEGFINVYRKTTDLVQSCDCIRDILAVFYRNSQNEIILTKLTSLSGVDEILHNLFAMPREAGGSGSQYHSGIIYFEQILEAVKEKNFAKVCDGLEGHQLWSREYIIKNLKTVKEAK